MGLQKWVLSLPGSRGVPSSMSFLPVGDHLVATCLPTSVVHTLPLVSTVIICGI